jgi:hypothetical protein
MTVLQANHIPYETIDGADPLYKDRYVLVPHRYRTSYCSILYCIVLSINNAMLHCVALRFIATFKCQGESRIVYTTN